MTRERDLGSEEIATRERLLRSEVIHTAKVTNFEKGYISVSFVNQLIDPNLQGLAADMIVDHFRDSGINKVVGIPYSGIPLATSVAERFNISLVPGRKGNTVPGAWKESIVVNEDTPSFTTGEASKFVFNGLSEKDHVLLIDDFMALGATSKLIAEEFRKHKINVSIAVYVAKLFQNGVNLITNELGINPFYVVGIQNIHPDGSIVLAPPHY